MMDFSFALAKNEALRLTVEERMHYFFRELVQVEGPALTCAYKTQKRRTVPGTNAPVPAPRGFPVGSKDKS